MKNVFKLLGIIAIMAIIGLVAISCDSSSGGTNDPCKDGHTFPAWTAPTCTAEGNSVRTCINCTQADTRATGFAVLGHQGLTPATATCTTSGSSESGTCTREGCGEVITGTIIPALGHQGLTSAKAATCTTGGNESESGICRRPGCGEVVIGTVILPLGHLDNDWDWLTYFDGKVNCNRSGCTGGFPVIGDTGPAGGKIIYIALTGFTMTDDNSTAYYLEAAPANMPTGLRWSTLTLQEWADSGWDDSVLIYISGTRAAIGTGRKNTALILALDPTAPAALACRNYRVTGYESFTDWFFPSLDELHQLYLMRAVLGIPSYGSWFWSSTGDFEDADIKEFDDIGLAGGDSKVNPNFVRAVRAF